VLTITVDVEQGQYMYPAFSTRAGYFNTWIHYQASIFGGLLYNINPFTRVVISYRDSIQSFRNCLIHDLPGSYAFVAEIL